MTTARIRRLMPGDEAMARRAVDAFAVLRPARSELERFLADERNVLYVAELDTEPIGFLLTHDREIPADAMRCLFLYQADRPGDHRFEGVGEALVRMLHRQFGKERFANACVITNDPSLPSPERSGQERRHAWQGG